MDDAVTRLRAAGCVFADAEAQLIAESAVDDPDAAERMIARRIAGEPLEHVLGWVEFAGRRLVVAPGVFVPRRRTELIARLAIARTPHGGTLVDLCCGSGAIASAVAHARPDLRVVAADVDPAAVALAARNLAGTGASCLISDMEDRLAHHAGTVDVVTACPPYVPSGEIVLMPREAREHEPLHALDGGPDGTGPQRHALEAASKLLRHGGAAIVETSEALVALTARAAEDQGLMATVARDDSLGAVAVVAQRR